MSGAVIRPARGAADQAAVVALCRDFRDWLYARYPDGHDVLDLYYAPESWEALLADLPRCHAPPGGEILVAEEAGRLVGCVMLQAREGGDCEMKRLFVAAGARQAGLGRRLCEELIGLARARGYRRMLLDTGIAHLEARVLYRRLGFREIEPYYDCPAPLRRLLGFFELAL